MVANSRREEPERAHERRPLLRPDRLLTTARSRPALVKGWRQGHSWENVRGCLSNQYELDLVRDMTFMLRVEATRRWKISPLYIRIKLHTCLNSWKN